MTVNAEKTLEGCRVLVTRPVEQNEPLCNIINTAGGIAVSFPVIEIQLPLDITIPKKLICEINAEAIVIFISSNAVISAEKIQNTIFEKLAGSTVFGIGATTAQLLNKKGMKHVVHVDGLTGSEALLEKEELQTNNLSGGKVFIVRGEGGRELLADTLHERGANVTYIDVYKRVVPAYDGGVIAQLWRNNSPDIIVSTSVEGLQNLLKMSGNEDHKIIFNIPLVVISRRMQEIALSMGFLVEPVIADEISNEGLFNAVITCKYNINY